MDVCHQRLHDHFEIELKLKLTKMKNFKLKRFKTQNIEEQKYNLG